MKGPKVLLLFYIVFFIFLPLLCSSVMPSPEKGEHWLSADRNKLAPREAGRGCFVTHKYTLKHHKCFVTSQRPFSWGQAAADSKASPNYHLALWLYTAIGLYGDNGPFCKAVQEFIYFDLAYRTLLMLFTSENLCKFLFVARVCREGLGEWDIYGY